MNTTNAHATEPRTPRTLNSLEATLAELVALARHLRATPANIPSRLAQLKDISEMLIYYTTPVHPYAPPHQPPLAAHTRCAFEGCEHTWDAPDACLLNFAPRGEPALWLCRDHHPPLGDGGIRPPGWTPPLTEAARVEAARKAALALLSRDQLRLVNDRMRGA